jgi:hypothetical protein
MERFNLRKLNELEVNKNYHIKISNRFAVLEYLNYWQWQNRAWVNITENIKTSAEENMGLYDLKQYKPWCEEECLRCLVKGSRLKCSSYRSLTKAM